MKAPGLQKSGLEKLGGKEDCLVQEPVHSTSHRRGPRSLRTPDPHGFTGVFMAWEKRRLSTKFSAAFT